eukprot:8545179-Alexandrium_andersonii.AAC.1
MSYSSLLNFTTRVRTHDKDVQTQALNARRTPFSRKRARVSVRSYSGVPASARPGARRALTRLHPGGDPDLLGRLGKGALGSVAVADRRDGGVRLRADVL